MCDKSFKSFRAFATVYLRVYVNCGRFLYIYIYILVFDLYFTWFTRSFSERDKCEYDKWRVQTVYRHIYIYIMNQKWPVCQCRACRAHALLCHVYSIFRAILLNPANPLLKFFGCSSCSFLFLRQCGMFEASKFVSRCTIYMLHHVTTSFTSSIMH